MHRNLPERRSKVALKWADQRRRTSTIWVALVGNIVVAAAKLVAGLLTGSSAMLAEAAHSFADSINVILLGVSQRRSKKPADSAHPFGHGQERFLWAFLAAIASFTVGGCVSIGLAIGQLHVHTEHRNQTISWIVLGVALLADGASWLQGVNQARAEARDLNLSVPKYLRETSDPVLRAVVVEDSAALIGIGLAAGGLLASRIMGSSTPDAIASLLIGALLAATAYGLARRLADFLIGRSLRHEQLGEIQKLIESSPAVESVIGLRAIYIGPGEAMVAAKVNASCTSIAEFASAMDELDHRIRESIPLVADVFVDVTAYRPEEQNTPNNKPDKD